MQTQHSDYAHKKVFPKSHEAKIWSKLSLKPAQKTPQKKSPPKVLGLKNSAWKLPSFDLDFWQRSFLGLLISICLIGLFFVFEASTAESFRMIGNPYHFLRQQSLWMVLGIGTGLVGWLWPLDFWRRSALALYGVAIFCLVAVFLPGIGLELNGAHRWLHLGAFVLQPAEVTKFALIVFFASWFTKHQRLGAFLLFLSLPLGLILLQPDLGSLLVVLGIILGMYVLANGNLTKLLPVGLIGFLVLMLIIVLSPYRLARLTTYLNPELDPLGKGFHVRQVTLGLGNGGLFGQGIGNSTQKYLYIPEASSDSIFAIVGEEVGFIGASLIIFLFVTLIWLIFKLVTRAPAGSFQRLVGMGIFLWVSSQIVLNLAAVVALVPLTGVPLPFFSYGGSSLLMLFFIMGIVLQISRKPT